MKTSILTLLGTSLLTLVAGLVQAADPPMKDGPAGIGKARFGMTVKEVKAALPKLEKLSKPLGAATVQAKNISNYVLWKSDLNQMPKPSDIELRFWDEKLWVVIIYFGDNDEEAVIASIKKQLGEPGGSSKNVWPGGKTTTVVASKQKWYSMSDNMLSGEAQKAFMEDLQRSLKAGGGNPRVQVITGATPTAAKKETLGVSTPTVNAP